MSKGTYFTLFTDTALGVGFLLGGLNGLYDGHGHVVIWIWVWQSLRRFSHLWNSKLGTENFVEVFYQNY